MCDELERDWLGEDMTEPFDKRAAALQDIGRGMEWARRRQGLWNALAELFEEAGDTIPNADTRVQSERKPTQGADIHVYELTLPHAGLNDEAHELRVVIRSFGDGGDIVCTLQRSLGDEAGDTRWRAEDVPMLLPFVRHSLLDFLNAWIHEVRQRGDLNQRATE